MHEKTRARLLALLMAGLLAVFGAACEDEAGVDDVGDDEVLEETE